MKLLKRQYIMIWFKKLLLFRPTIKKNIKIVEIKKISDRNKNSTTQKIDKLTTESFDDQLKQAIIASKNDIADFVKTRDFDEKLINLIKKLLQIKQYM